MRRITYGPGGFDPSRADRNKLEEYELLREPEEENADRLHELELLYRDVLEQGDAEWANLTAEGRDMVFRAAVRLAIAGSRQRCGHFDTIGYDEKQLAPAAGEKRLRINSTTTKTITAAAAGGGSTVALIEGARLLIGG